MNYTIKIGTRGSKLALWQANHVAALLSARGIGSELVIVETKGDKNLNQPLSKIGTKGLFTEEIEAKLISQEIDIAVHSAKDMQSVLPDGLEIIAFMEREDANDVLVSRNAAVTLETISQYTIGTSSVRRQALLRNLYPGIQLTESRGNLQTRIKKMEDGQCDALVLAYAGIHRMDCDHLIRAKFPLDIFTPAVAQGSIAIEASENLSKDKRNKLNEILNHSNTAICLEAERAFLHQMEGGCSIPNFCLASIAGSVLTLNGGIASPDGELIVRKSVSGISDDRISLGASLATKVLAGGGQQILQEILKNKATNV